MWQSALNQGCARVQEEKEVLQKGGPKNLLVQLEDRAGGRKHITRLSGGSHCWRRFCLQ